MSRYTQPEVEQKLLLENLKLKLPEPPPPKITAPQAIYVSASVNFRF